MPLRSIFNDLQHKKQEVDIICKHLSKIERLTGNAKLCALLKSACCIILYNAVESTVFYTLNIVHENLSQKTYKNLSEHQKKIFVIRYFERCKSEQHLENLNSTIDCTLKFPLFSDYMNFDKMFSGNLDVRKINKILKKYGVKFLIDEKYSNSFLYIKTIRNKLAHGESSFSTTCRNYTVSEIESISNDIFTSLELMVQKINDYIIDCIPTNMAING